MRLGLRLSFAFLAVVVTFALSPAALAQGKKIGITWLGHAAFEIVSPGGTTLLVDPFLKGNPKTPKEQQDLTRYKPSAILVTHSHGDHKGDAVEIASKTGAPVIGSFDFIQTLKLPDGQKMGGNVGGSFRIGDCTISLVPAVHGSEPDGRPLGFVIRFDDGRSIYHTGDTWIFGDMALIQELHRPEIILLAAGGGPFTQTPEVAALAVKKFFKPKTIVPMHYGTFPVLAQEDEVKKAFVGDKRALHLVIGKKTEL